MKNFCLATKWNRFVIVWDLYLVKLKPKLKFKLFQDGDDKYSMHQSFAVHAHIGSIRSVHASGKYLASGGADDRIYVYDMKKRQEVQVHITAQLNLIQLIFIIIRSTVHVSSQI